MDFWQQYRAIDARDARFDGQFVTAVSSTGIYCRPSCPARTPKPEHVSFYRTSAAAHEAGYRACRRCLPEAVPGTPEWSLRSDTAGRAMRLILDGEVDRGGVGGLATRLGYSTRQLNRILRQELGAGAASLARAARAQTARSLLTATTMNSMQVSAAAGFGSVRQFNDTVREIFGLSPTELRAAARRVERIRRSAPAGANADGHIHLSLVLPLRDPYDNGIFEFLGARAVESVEVSAATSYERTILLPGGQGWFRASPVRPAGSATQTGMAVSILLEKLADLPALLARVRRLLDLDADPVAVDRTLMASPTLSAQVRQVPGIRLPGTTDPHELVIRALVGQQISVAAATGFLNRLAACGSPSVFARDGTERLFPSAAQIAAQAPPLLRGPARRRDAIRAVAEALAEGRLSISMDTEPAELERSLLALPGIGPWTAGYVAMRVLGATDVVLAHDSALRKGWLRSCAPSMPGVTRSSNHNIDRRIAAELAPLSPWRSYASMHLWRAAATPLSSPRTGLRPDKPDSD